MAGDGRGEAAVALEQHVAGGEERTIAAGAAEDPIETADDRGGRRVDVELRAERGVRHGHDQPRRHPVPRGIAEKDGQAAVGQRHEVVDVAADRVGDAIEGRDLVLVELRHHLRDQPRLKVARELELVADLDLVRQLHRQQQRHQQERHSHLDERPEMERAALRGHPDQAEEEPDERDQEDDPAGRRLALGQTVQDRAARAEEAADATLALDGVAMIRDQHLPRLGPFLLVETGYVARLERRDGALPKLNPVTDFGHGSFYGERRPRFEYAPTSARA